VEILPAAASLILVQSVGALRTVTVVSAVMEGWFSAIKTLTIQKLSSLTCGILMAKLLMLAVESMSLRRKPRSQFARNKIASGNIQLVTVLDWYVWYELMMEKATRKFRKNAGTKINKGGCPVGAKMRT
jgi:hypothetical protein